MAAGAPLPFQLIETKLPANIDETNLYLCFRESSHDNRVALRIQAINLGHLLNNNNNNTEEGEYPQTVAYRMLDREDEGGTFGCGFFAEAIIFAGVVPDRVYFFKPGQPNSGIARFLTPLHSGKIQPFVVEMDNHHLYVLGRAPNAGAGSNFEQFRPDPTDPNLEWEWAELPEPPYDQIGPYFCPATDGNNIFLFGKRPEAYAARFSISNNIWKTYSAPQTLKFTVGPPALIVEDHDSEHRILFNYEFSPRGGPDTPLFIGAHLMSDDDDDDDGDGRLIFCGLNNLQFRRGVPSEFCGSQYQLVHLGERHILLILYSFSPQIPDHQHSNATDCMKLCVIHLEYEYEFHPTRDLRQSPFLLSRRGDPHILEYPYEYGPPWKQHVSMIGAFVLSDTDECDEDGSAYDDTQETRRG